MVYSSFVFIDQVSTVVSSSFMFIFRGRNRRQGKKKEACFSYLKESIVTFQRGPSFGEIEVAFVGEECAMEAVLNPVYGDCFVAIIHGIQTGHVENR